MEIHSASFILSNWLTSKVTICIFLARKSIFPCCIYVDARVVCIDKTFHNLLEVVNSAKHSLCYPIRKNTKDNL